MTNLQTRSQASHETPGQSWDPIWEEVHQTQNWGKYPPEELIRFVARSFFSAPDRKQVRILELGCGAGANVWFCAREGFDAYGIDGSETAVKNAATRMQEEGVDATLSVGDFCNLTAQYPANHFDAVIDVASLESNRLPVVHSILSQTAEVLKPGGKVFSMLVAAGSLGDGLGREIEPGTYTDITDGPVQGKGQCHFFTEEELTHLFAPFSNVKVEYSIRSIEGGKSEFKHWVVEGTK